MNTTHPRLATILPAIAAEIDVQRPMLSPLFATFIGVQIAEDTHTVWLHTADEATHSFLSIPTQIEGVRAAFSKLGFPNYHVNIYPVTWSDTSETSAPADKPQKRTANALTFMERDALRQWMQQSDNTHLVAHESDTHAAAEATRYFSQLTKPATTEGGDGEPAFPGLTITPANIASMRKLLGIEKVKPEKPQPLTLPEGVTLAGLQQEIAKLNAAQIEQGIQLTELQVEATSMKATIAELHGQLTTVIDYLRENSHILTAMPSIPSGQSSQ